MTAYPARPEFNGVNVLAKDGSMKIQVGANDGETITIDLKKIDSSTLNLTGFNVNGKGEVANTKATADNLKLAGFTKGTTDANGVTDYKNTIANSKASASDLLANISDKSVITGGGANAFGVAATAGYKYDAASKSYSFDATGADSAKTLSIINPNTGDSSQATVTIGGKDQKVNISQDGKITAADDNATLYLDKQGNLTKTNAGGDAAATWDGLISNSDSTGAVPVGVKTKITLTSGAASGMSVSSEGAGSQTSTNAQILADGAFAAKVSIDGGAATDIMVANNGNITAADGSALYLDATTGGFTATAAGNTAATLDALIANGKTATMTVASGTSQNTVYSTTGSADFTSLAKVDTVNITNAHVSAEGMANLTKGANFTLDLGGTGTATHTVTAGVVKDAANDDVYVDDGALSSEPTKDVTYFEQKNGAITNSTGGTIYETADGKLTTEATTASTSTANPLKALDDAISQIDKFRLPWVLYKTVWFLQ